MDSTAVKKINPLTSLMRQPKIYIRLPSNGQYWTEGSLNQTTNGEYPVFSMTAKDELMLKTPDALLNGQAVVDVIQSCMPNIIDAWAIPNIDIDVILIAIRLATFGENMDTTINIGEEDMTYTVNLREVLDRLQNQISWQERLEIGKEMVLFIKPVNYAVASQTSIQNFETQKILSLVNSSQLTEEQKIETFRESFKKLTSITVDVINSSVYRIESIAGTTEDPDHIKEFLENSDAHIFDSIKQHLESMRERNGLKPIKVRPSQEMIDNGVSEEIEIPLTFDPANFFA